jgi:hypothetical protein
MQRLLGAICERAVRAGTDDRNRRRKRARTSRRVGLLLLVPLQMSGTTAGRRPYKTQAAGFNMSEGLWGL